MIAAFQWDLGRQVERLDWLLAQLPRYADWGYRELYLHLEDAVEYPSLPKVARPDAYRYRDLERLVAAAARRGIGVVPIVNLLGHTQYLIKVPELRDLNELRAPDGSPFPSGQVCPLHPRILEVADALIGDMAPFCTTGKVHVGLDESFQLGRHPLSAAEVAEAGLAAHFGRYVRKLGAVAAARGLRIGLWADMLALLPEAVDYLPPGSAAYDWYYYPFSRRPRIEMRGFAEYELAPALKARGVEYWGCPMNGAFRYEPMPVFGERLANIRDWWRRCRAVGAHGLLVTSWEPNRLAIEMTTVVDAAAASLWLDPGADDAPTMLAAGFIRTHGVSRERAAELSRRALACDEMAFAGYARWEINERWDTCDVRRGWRRYAAERDALRRLERRRASLPKPFAASIAFRRYLADRDVFVRAATALVLSLRRKLARHGPSDAALARGIAALIGATGEFAAMTRSGLAAARAVWRLTRDPGVQSPNERIVRSDAARARSLLRWLRRCAAAPRLLAGACELQGAWQLRFDVVLTEPALQKVVVEARDADGSWRTLHSRVVIEFRAEAARPRTSIRREFSVPVPGPDAVLRIALRGIGRLAIAHVDLTDGARSLRPAAARRRPRILGRKAPREGFPDLDWTRNEAVHNLTFQAPD